jgi:CBS domain containing-hemolysin-like protein
MRIGRHMPAEKVVKDLMRPLERYAFVNEESSAQHAMRLFAAQKETATWCLLVVGRDDISGKEVITGFVTAAELIFGPADHFLKGARSNAPIFWESQLEAEYSEGAKKRVADIMLPIQGYVRETEMLMEAVYLLNKYQVRFLPVVNQEDVTGIIHLEDILREVAGIVLQRRRTNGFPTGKED